MNTVEGFFAVGAIAGPAIVATLIAAGLSWKWLYVIAAAICLVLVHGRKPRANTRESKGQSSRPRFARWSASMQDPLALGFSALVVLYVAVEGAVYVWMPTYLSLRGLLQMARRLRAHHLFRAARRRAIRRRLVPGQVAAGPRRSWSFGFAILLCFAGSLSGAWRRARGCCRCRGCSCRSCIRRSTPRASAASPRAQHGAAAGVILFFTAAAAAFGPLAMAAVSDDYGSRARASCWRPSSRACCSPDFSPTGCSIPPGARLRDRTMRGAPPQIAPPSPAPQGAPASIRHARRMKNQVQLIAYADRLGGTLHGSARAAAGTARETVRRRAPAAVLSIRSTAPMRASTRSTTRSRCAPGLVGGRARDRGRGRRDGRRHRQSHLEPLAAVPRLFRER